MPSVAAAQAKYPSKFITWVCPYGAGGSADLRSRQIGRLMSEMLGQSIVVDNKPGAGGNIGTEVIAKAKPDGYVIGMGNFAPMSVNKSLFKKINFDPLSDLSPIMLIERGPLVLMVRNDSPYKSVAEVVNAAKTSPGKLAYASGGIGGTHHLSGSLFEYAAGIDMIHAAYKSGSAGQTDLMGGQVNMMFEQMYAAMPSIKGGKLRALAVTSKARAPLLPDVPTMAEAGYPQVEVLNWQGIIGPKGLAADIVKLLNETGNRALQDPGLRKIMLDQGNEIAGGTPDQFAALVMSESARWAKAIKDAKVEPE